MFSIDTDSEGPERRPVPNFLTAIQQLIARMIPATPLSSLCLEFSKMLGYFQYGITERDLFGRYNQLIINYERSSYHKVDMIADKPDLPA